MIEFAIGLVTLAGKILLFVISFKLFWMLITKGKGLLSDLVETILMAIRTVNASLKRWLFKQYKGKEEKKPSENKETEKSHPNTTVEQSAQATQQTTQPPYYGSWNPPPYNW